MATRRLISTAAALGAAGVVSLSATAAWAAPAQAPQRALTGATTTVIPLKQAHLNQPASHFENSCGQIPGGKVAAGKDGWVFVLPGDVGGEFKSLAIVFKNKKGDPVPVAIESDNKDLPNGIVDSGRSKAYVITPAGWTILKGEAVITGAKDDKGAGYGKDNGKNDDKGKGGDDKGGKGKTADFNVTHVCQGGPGNGGGNGGGGNGGGNGGGGGNNGGGSSSAPVVANPNPASGNLPVTGASVGGLIGVAFAMVAAGAGLFVWRRRRDQVTFTA